MMLYKMAAFSDGVLGGNPAGVSLATDRGARLPRGADMQATAKQVGFSETAFAVPARDGWRVRYFAPESEVPFCGHATIALAAVLAQVIGEGRYTLYLNDAQITAQGQRVPPIQAQAKKTEMTKASQALYTGALTAPPPSHTLLPDALYAQGLGLFGLRADQLDPRLPPAIIQAGARHLLLPLQSRSDLAGMTYDLAQGQALMRAYDLITIALVHASSAPLFHARNAFASGGVWEDPATGAAAAALGGYLRARAWPHKGAITILQGQDMGIPCRLEVMIPQEGPVTVSGTVRMLAGP
ncbi:MAG: PhzF family phenazine biosynthesis protein [Pseudomonadota bacterium]